MALIKCPECGHEVSSAAFSCPNCGFPLKIRSSVRIENPEKGPMPKDIDFYCEYARHIINLHEKALCCISDYIRTANAPSEKIFFELAEEAADCILELYIDCSAVNALCPLLDEIRAARKNVCDICANVINRKHSPKELADLIMDSANHMENALKLLTETIE